MPVTKGAVLLPEQTAPGTPATGRVALYAKTDGKVYIKDDAGTETDITTPGGGGGSSSADYTLTTDYSSTVPAAPATGIKVFARHRARRLLAAVGPTGLDTAYQPGIFTNRVAWIQPLNNLSTPGNFGIAAPTVYSTAAAAVSNAATNFFTGMVRNRYASPSTANGFAGFRIANPQFFLSSTANMGGFFWVIRLGINAGTATGRGFFGLSATNATEANTDSTGLLNRMGFAFGTGSTNLYFHSAGASTNATTVDLGTAFPARTYATNFWEFRLFVPSGAGQTLYWAATRLNDGTVVQGGPVTTNLPAVNTLLTPQVWMNNVTASVVSFDFQSMYVETDN